MNELNRLVKKILGKKMTKEQLRFQNELRKRVKNGEITGIDAQIIWSTKYKLDTLEFWQNLKKEKERVLK